jgi:hypothetical protein
VRHDQRCVQALVIWIYLLVVAERRKEDEKKES